MSQYDWRGDTCFFCKDFITEGGEAVEKVNTEAKRVGR